MHEGQRKYGTHHEMLNQHALTKRSAICDMCCTSFWQSYSSSQSLVLITSSDCSNDSRLPAPNPQTKGAPLIIIIIMGTPLIIGGRRGGVASTFGREGTLHQLVDHKEGAPLLIIRGGGDISSQVPHPALLII